MNWSCRVALVLATSLMLPVTPISRGVAQTNSSLAVTSQSETLELAADAAEPSPPEPVEMNLPIPIPADITEQNDAYAPLRSFLAEKNWQAADQETRRLLERWVHPNGDIYGAPLASAVPVEVIQTIDQLWLEASEGRFGLSVQQRIWQESVAQHPNDMNEAIRTFGRRVGWVRMPPTDDGTLLWQEWLTEPELTNSLEAPTGHFPWPGLSWDRIQSLFADPSCGSCTIDAMYLQGDRFYRYIPVLYSRVETALTTPLSPAVQAWRTLRSRFQIDLNSLYPNNRCPVEVVDQAISPNSQILAVSSYSYERACGGEVNNTTLVLWNAQRGNRIITLMRGQALESFNYQGQPQEPPTEQDRIVGQLTNAIAFTPDSQRIAAGLSNGTIQIWRTDTGQSVQTLTGHRYAVRAIAISTDGTLLVSASSDQTLRVWNLQTGQAIRTINLNEADGRVHTVLISPDNRRVAIATGHNLLQLRDLGTGQLIRTFLDEGSNQADWMPMAFSPDGRFLATGDGDHNVKLWNASNGARIITLQGHQAAVKDLAFSPDSTTLASSSEDYSVKLWNLQTYQLQRSLNANTSGQSFGEPPQSPGHLSFTNNGQILASSALLPFRHPISGEPLTLPGTILWDVSTGQAVTTVDSVSSFSFSPNSQFLLTNGHQINVWQPQ